MTQERFEFRSETKELLQLICFFERARIECIGCIGQAAI